MAACTPRSVLRAHAALTAAAALSFCPDALAAPIAYVTALFEDSVLRLQDTNADGDAHDAGESIVFFGPGNASGFPGVGSAQCILALALDDVLVADGEESPPFVTAVYRLTDLNGDGDAMDPGEAYVYWDATLPFPFLTNYDRPKQLIELPDGSILLADNNTINFDNDAPEAVWQLTDLNTDGDVNDFGEVTLYKQLADAGEPFGFVTEQYERTGDGRVFFSNLDSSTNTTNLWAIEDDPARTLTPIASSSDIPGIAWRPQSMTLSPFTGRPTFTATDLTEVSSLAEVIDLTGDGDADDPGELVVRYLSSTAAESVEWEFSNTFDLATDPEGALWLIDFSGLRILRFVDLDADQAFQSAGEVTVVFDTIAAQANGAASTNFPRALAFAPADACPPDITGDGILNNADINAFVGAFLSGSLAADLTGDGILNNADINLFVQTFLAGC